MQDFQRKKKIRKFIYSRNVVIVLAVVAILLLKGAVGVVSKMRLSESNLATLNAQLAEAQTRNQELNNQTASLSTTAGVEREIRQKFSVTKPGEEVAIVVDPTVPKPVATSTQAGFWGSIANWFGNIFH
jgi:cell division protein FtsB